MILAGLVDTDAGDFGGVFLCDEGGRPYAMWVDLEVGNVPAGDGATGGVFDAWDVAFSPLYEDDEQSMALVTDETETWITTRIGGTAWAGVVDDIELQANEDPTPAGDIVADGKGWICFPSDYDSDPDSGYYTLFVGTHCVDPADGDVYEVLGDGEVALDLDCDNTQNITSFDCVGDADDAYLMAGLDYPLSGGRTQEERVKRSTDAGGDWKSALKEPTGECTDVYVVLADDVADTDQAWAAIGDNDGGISLQVDDRIWNTIGLIDYDLNDINDLSIVGDVVFMATDEGTTDHCIWRQASGWERLFSETLEDAGGLQPNLVEASPGFADDETVFIAELGSANEIMYSNDGGNRFKEQIREPDAALEGWIVIDDDTIIVGQTGFTQKTTNNGRSWKDQKTLTNADDVQHFALAPGYATDGAADEGHILAGTSNGRVFRSLDDAAKWGELKDANADMLGNSVIPAFHPEYGENSTMFCTAADDGGVYRYVKGTSSEWAKIDHKSGAPTSESTTGVSTEITEADAFTITCTGAPETVSIQELSMIWLTSQISVVVTTEAGAVATTINYVAPGNWTITFGDVGDVVTVTAVNTSVASASGTITGTAGTAVVALAEDDDGDAFIPAGAIGGGVSYTLPDEEEVVSETTTTVSSKPYTVADGTGLVVSPDGVLYATDSSAKGEGMSRCINPTADITPSWDVFFEQVNYTMEGTLAKALRGLWYSEGSNVLWSIYFDPDDTTYDMKIYYLTDTLSGKVTLNSPANGKSSLRVTSVTFSWDEMEGAKKYQIQVDTQENFKGARLLSEVDKDTTYTLDEIPSAYQGIPLYWRVRVYEQEPYRSNWSDKWSFSTQLAEGQWNPFVGDVSAAPSPGATGVPLVPTFAWNQADWATGYDFEIALDSAFTIPGWSLTGKNALKTSVYTAEHELEYSTTYYWRVRAISGSSQSEWAVGVFTTMAEPTTPPPPTPQPTPTLTVEPIIMPTPVPLWALISIIAVGGILVIVVIVLIVRTRRPI
jgi:hypothetical protein